MSWREPIWSAWRREVRKRNEMEAKYEREITRLLARNANLIAENQDLRRLFTCPSDARELME